MKVRREKLPGGEIDALVAVETDRDRGIRKGETVGYRCTECEQADETLKQIGHLEDCSVGEAYDPPANDDEREFDPENLIDMVVADACEGVHRGDPLIFRCRECGNGDETVSEIEHDTSCVLNRIDENLPQAGRVRADGGRQD